MSAMASAQNWLMPCDRGVNLPRGLHHFQAGVGGVVACIYCGKRGPSEPIIVSYGSDTKAGDRS